MIGLSTYAYFWRMGSQVPNPMSLDDVLRDTAELGLGLFQICDYSALESFDRAELTRLKHLADSLGIRLEIGTRGVDSAHLLRWCEIAQVLDARLVRSMWSGGASDKPSLDEGIARLERAMGAYEKAGITLGLETYEQFGSASLIRAIERVGSERLGVCLDPANCVANLETPAVLTSLCEQYTVNWHVKDFRFVRRDGWVGFSLVGAPLGEGLLPYADMLRSLKPKGRGINQIIEHWLPWSDDAATTVRLESEWTSRSLEYLSLIELGGSHADTSPTKETIEGASS